MKEGEGAIYYGNGAFYKGNFSQDRPNGFGIQLPLFMRAHLKMDSNMEMVHYLLDRKNDLFRRYF
jgi:hypothetical protein